MPPPSHGEPPFSAKRFSTATEAAKHGARTGMDGIAPIEMRGRRVQRDSSKH